MLTGTGRVTDQAGYAIGGASQARAHGCLCWAVQVCGPPAVNQPLTSSITAESTMHGIPKTSFTHYHLLFQNLRPTKI
jgi:hypothetical protein